VLGQLNQLRAELLKPLSALVEQLLDERLKLELLPARWHEDDPDRPYRLIVVITGGAGQTGETVREGPHGTGNPLP